MDAAVRKAYTTRRLMLGGRGIHQAALTKLGNTLFMQVRWRAVVCLVGVLRADGVGVRATDVNRHTSVPERQHPDGPADICVASISLGHGPQLVQESTYESRR